MLEILREDKRTRLMNAFNDLILVLSFKKDDRLFLKQIIELLKVCKVALFDYS